MCEQRRTESRVADLQEDYGASAGIGFVSEDGDAAIGMLAVNDFGGGRNCDPQSFRTCGHAAIGSD